MPNNLRSSSICIINSIFTVTLIHHNIPAPAAGHTYSVYRMMTGAEGWKSLAAIESWVSNSSHWKNMLRPETPLPLQYQQFPLYSKANKWINTSIPIWLHSRWDPGKSCSSLNIAVVRINNGAQRGTIWDYHGGATVTSNRGPKNVTRMDKLGLALYSEINY